jgi:hypothetical protein
MFDAHTAYMARVKVALDTDSRDPINQVSAAGAGLGAATGAALVHKAVAPHVAMAKDEANYLKTFHAGKPVPLMDSLRINRGTGFAGKVHGGAMLAGAAAGAILGAAPGVVMALGNKFGEPEH